LYQYFGWKYDLSLILILIINELILADSEIIFSTQLLFEINIGV